MSKVLAEGAMKEFMKVYNLENLLKEPTCFKNPDRSSCNDVITHL